MPSQKIIDRLKNADQETKLEILDEHAGSVFEKADKKIQKTAAKQFLPLDKVYLALLFSAKGSYLREFDLLTEEEKYDLGIKGHRQIEDDDPFFERESQLFRDAAGSLLKVPPTLQDFENFYAMIGLIKAKAAHDLAKERDAIRKELPDNLDEPAKDELADYLAIEANILPTRILQATEQLKTAAGDMSFTRNGQSVEYSAYRIELLEADFKAKMEKPEYRNMTVREFCTLTGMAEDVQATISNELKVKCSPEDKIFDVYRRKARAAAEKKGKPFANEEEERSSAMKMLTASYCVMTEKGWTNSGAAKYEKGLQGAEKKTYLKGAKLQNLLGDERRAFEVKVGENIPNLKALEDKFTRDHIFKDTKQIDSYVLSEKPLMMREQPGLSESYNVGNEKNTERMFVTKGALLALEDTGTSWKHHSRNSDEFDKMVTAIRNYHQALAAGEGGKALTRKSEMLAATKNYIKDKYAKRRSPEGQQRFNTALTLLHEEMKPEEFRVLLQRVNGKRDEKDQISADALEFKKETFIVNAKDAEREAQEQTKDFATEFPLFYGYELGEIDTAAAPGPGEAYHAIGLRGNEMLGNLSNRDYSAISYTCALSSPKKNDNLINDSLLSPSKEQLANGKRAANTALTAYGQGNKQPLGELLSIALRRTAQEIQSHPAGTEKVVMTEINTRIKNMLGRDPELKKYALRSGLKEADLAPAAPEAESRNKNAAEKSQENKLILG